MSLEIERKFLLKNNDWKEHVTKKEPIIQGYLASSSDNGITVRIRVTGQHGYMTFKGPRVGFTRIEYEYEVPINDAKSILLESQAPTVKKVRHTLMHNGDEWVVDVFKGANKGLTVAEIELKSENQEVNLPVWVKCEVTGESKYRNSRLAANPFSTWTSDDASRSAA